MTDSADKRTGGCHCGAVRFEAKLSDGFASIRRCTCSYCRMRGAVVVMAAAGGVRVLQGEDVLTSYRFHTDTAQHFFCSRCGIYTHHQRRSDPTLHAVNVACLDGVSPFDFPAVPVMDGINHTNDTGQPTRRAGTLCFLPSDCHSSVFIAAHMEIEVGTSVEAFLDSIDPRAGECRWKCYSGVGDPLPAKARTIACGRNRPTALVRSIQEPVSLHTARLGRTWPIRMPDSGRAQGPGRVGNRLGDWIGARG